MATNIDGKAIAALVRSEVKEEVAALKEKCGKSPGLAVVLVGERVDSATYVRSKKKACDECGIEVTDVKLPGDASEEQIKDAVRELNNNPAIHGILVQLPLPDGVNEKSVLELISVEKDVDGFDPINVGLLAIKDREPFFTACTPTGCMELLKRSGVETKGKRAVVIGRSGIVGIPMAMLLNNADATVTICHSKTQDIGSVVREADIVVAAIGRANFVKGEWLKKGAVVIDVGINSVDDPTAKRGYRLCGDCDYNSCKEVASQITPVPGGVGPMTIAILMQNTLTALKRTL
eukprot:TRINITY_DN32481_c0_g1_i1.p1 TRINITY_DN32481_c0_g1~~TRINITY_DN32481_c0_g1_i1.p1  ORF type:complete len:291 (+),score=121.73 TRINITY_DN32481_c0_g1_i1:19-891(+)